MKKVLYGRGMIGMEKRRRSSSNVHFSLCSCIPRVIIVTLYSIPNFQIMTGGSAVAQW